MAWLGHLLGRIGAPPDSRGPGLPAVRGQGPGNFSCRHGLHWLFVETRLQNAPRRIGRADILPVELGSKGVLRLD
jgi:hypothetical protein